jgi:hypothetical protein
MWLIMPGAKAGTPPSVPTPACCAIANDDTLLARHTTIAPMAEILVALMNAE